MFAITGASCCMFQCSKCASRAVALQLRMGTAQSGTESHSQQSVSPWRTLAFQATIGGLSSSQSGRTLDIWVQDRLSRNNEATPFLQANDTIAPQ